MTTGELVALDLSDRPTPERPIIAVRKTHLAQRELAVSETTIHALERYLEVRPGKPDPGDPLFMGARGDRLKPRVVQLSLQDIRGVAGIRGPLTVRAVRHALAERMKAEGQSVEAVARQLGLAVTAAGRYFGGEERRRSAQVRRPTG
jgi:integrase/recombinase XerC